MKNEFSVLMSVYYKENPEYLKMAFDSIINQTLMPNEIILVEDGPLTDELNLLIKKYQRKYKILKVVKLEKNMGLGSALNVGLNECSNNIVFRMDTDDVCRKDRFELQIKYMLEHPDIDVLGTEIYEFKENIYENLRKKSMPTGNEINNYIKKRNPINHMSVCFKKNVIIKSGGYMPMLYLEDYFLWVRVLKNGYKIENMKEPLVYARIGNGFEKRRGNKKQIIGWKKLQKYMLENKMIGFGRYVLNIANMYVMVYTPNCVRKFAYNYILRK